MKLIFGFIAVWLVFCVAFARLSYADQSLKAVGNPQNLSKEHLIVPGVNILKFTPNNINDQSILKIAPPIDNGGANLAFWSSLSSTDRLRPLNIKTHGPADNFDKNYHVSFYTTDHHGNQPKALEWNWGAAYNAILKVPTMGLDIMRINNIATGTVYSPFGIKVRAPTLSIEETSVNYGVLIEDQTTPGRLGYSIYSEGGLNYFAGNIGIKVHNPSYTLDVGGDANFKGKIFSNGSEIHNISCSNFSFHQVTLNSKILLMNSPYSVNLTRTSLSVESNMPANFTLNFLLNHSEKLLGEARSVTLYKDNGLFKSSDVVELDTTIPMGTSIHLQLNSASSDPVSLAVTTCFNILT